jgi:hypothetical protein
MHDAGPQTLFSAVKLTRGQPGSRDRREDPLQYDNYSTFLLEGSRRFPWASTLDPATADMSRRPPNTALRFIGDFHPDRFTVDA